MVLHSAFVEIHSYKLLSGSYAALRRNQVAINQLGFREKNLPSYISYTQENMVLQEAFQQWKLAD